MSNHIKACVVALLLSGFPGVASASDWRNEVNASAATLRTGNYANSLKIADQVLSAMVELLGAGGADDATLAKAIMHKAPRKGGLGKINGALWVWENPQEIPPAG